MKSNVGRECHHRQCHFRRGRHLGFEERDELFCRHALSDIVMRHNQRAGFTHILIAAGVIAVPVGVQHKLDRLVTDLLERREYLRADRRVLIVDDEQRIFADGYTNIATCTEQDVSRRRKFFCLDFDLIEILLRLGRAEKKCEYDEHRSGQDVVVWHLGLHDCAC